MDDLLVIRDFLDAATREEIFAEMRLAVGDPATVYGREQAGAVESRVRKATRLVVSRETRERVVRQLLDGRRAIEGHFGLSLSECEEPQFLRYQTGDFFVAHQDGNTGLLRSEREDRKVSAVVFLNSQAETSGPDAYRGGSLVFHPRGAGERLRLAGEAGTLVLFRAETTHEVEPVTGGERFTIASWYK